MLAECVVGPTLKSLLFFLPKVRKHNSTKALFHVSWASKARKTRGPEKTLGKLPPLFSHLSLVLLAVLLALPWPPWTPSNLLQKNPA